MHKYQIKSNHNTDMGTFEGRTKTEAVCAMYQDAGSEMTYNADQDSIYLKDVIEMGKMLENWKFVEV